MSSTSGFLLLILSSPSGAGKTTLTRMLLEQCPELRFSVSHTTRAPRNGEVDGRDYHFVDRARFVELVGQEAFLEGHVTAFARLGGVPARIRYDNARALVARVLRGRDRAETERFTALRSHYGFDSFFCIPGEEGAHEKGGIEGEVGRQRRRFFVPVPRVKSLAELNRRLEAADRADLARHIGARRKTVGAMGVGAAEMRSYGRAAMCRPGRAPASAAATARSDEWR